MTLLAGFVARLRALFHPTATDNALNEEIRFHL
jgi:hypothetical protein